MNKTNLSSKFSLVKILKTLSNKISNIRDQLAKLKKMRLSAFDDSMDKDNSPPDFVNEDESSSSAPSSLN